MWESLAVTAFSCLYMTLLMVCIPTTKNERTIAAVWCLTVCGIAIGFTLTG